MDKYFIAELLLYTMIMIMTVSGHTHMSILAQIKWSGDWLSLSEWVRIVSQNRRFVFVQNCIRNIGIVILAIDISVSMFSHTSDDVWRLTNKLQCWHRCTGKTGVVQSVDVCKCVCMWLLCIVQNCDGNCRMLILHHQNEHALCMNYSMNEWT